MTIKFTTGNKEVVVVVVPEGAKSICLAKSKSGKPTLMYYTGDFEVSNIKIPQGNWQLLGNPLTMTEEECVPLVEVVPYYDPTMPLEPIPFYKNYRGGHYMHNAKQSLISRLESLGLVLINHCCSPSEVGTKQELLYAMVKSKWQQDQQKLQTVILLWSEVSDSQTVN